MAFGSSAPVAPANRYRTGCLGFAGLSVVLAGLLVFLLVKRGTPGDAAQAAGLRVLDAQQAAWNRGDLAAFTATYRMHGDLTFYSEGRAYKGWEQLNDRYRTMYGGRPMGELHYDDTMAEALSPTAVVVRGKWTLKSDAGTRTGLFTIVAREFDAPEGWKIVHDHVTIGELR